MRLSRIESLAAAAVLEDCSDELDVLGLTVALRADKQRGPARAKEKVRLTNLRRDCQSISQQVLKLSSELEEKQSFSSLLAVLEEVKQEREAEEMKRQAKAELRQRITTLQRQQAEVQQRISTLKERSVLAEKLQEQLDDQKNRKAVKKILEEKRMALQLEQVLSNNRKAEKQLEDQREMVQIQLTEEREVHEKSVKFLQNRQEELQLLQQQWQRRTVQMLQEKKLEVATVCCKRTLNLDKLSEMRRKIREMERVVMEDREEQEKLRQQQREARAATKVQEWWRGCMARRGLGSFKKADDKKGEKKKRKKKKEVMKKK
uniref:Dynein regulatory complex protein 9 n=1 Tax=Gasterosteus aculeatus aculeatus TaxID=481459 RepID=A0AAQ4QKM0_GASAC|nr:dynein regulatory complex protein 9-like [Gasterosteus aculeatus aculeatus]XP_040020061.1 dynein regulatory complex protein 9-like [Gasterosteus aculeatus aculeatus]